MIDENGIEKATYEAPTIDGYEPNYTDVRYAIHQKVLDVELEQGQYFIKVKAQQLNPQLYAVSVSPSIQE